VDIVAKATDTSIIAVDKFIQATRDSGYRSTVSAIAEIIDNALQANASRVDVIIVRADEDHEHPIQLAVLDNGEGMTKDMLHQSLRFGGSSRFNDRQGLGRYGMGLPNASLSQAKRLRVLSWRCNRTPYATYIDVDEIAQGEMPRVPKPEYGELPAWVNGSKGPSGTLVQWIRCDRLDNRRISTLERKLAGALGRMFRYYLWDGVTIAINGRPITAVDPLYLRPDALHSGAKQFQEVLEYEIRAPSLDGGEPAVGSVFVTFSELPVQQWHSLTNEEKRRLGVANGAGVSVVRGGREIEYGWFFMGSKRRENYDDWWRCEVRFDPVLDEAFGITHTKQQIRPQEYLQEVLSTDISLIAKALNKRVRDRHAQVKTANVNRSIEALATKQDAQLKPLPKQGATDVLSPAFERLAKKHDIPLAGDSGGVDVEYRLVEDAGVDTAFFTPLRKNGQIVILINKHHPFYKKIYEPLTASGSPEAASALRGFQMILIAAARAELMAGRQRERDVISTFRNVWSEALDVYVRGQ
jgi:hypothetical protein